MDNWKTLIEEHPKNVLDWSTCVNKDRVVLGYINDVKSVLQVHSLHDGSFVSKFPLEIGTVVGFSGKKKYSEIFYHFVSFLTPGIIYHYDFAKEGTEPKIFRQVKIEDFDNSLYKVDQVFYESKDGERIPMFVVQRKSDKVATRFTKDPLNLKTNKTIFYPTAREETVPSVWLWRIQHLHPTVLQYYRAGVHRFVRWNSGLSEHPWWRVSPIATGSKFEQKDHFDDIAFSEYGERWHNAGRLLKKQNVFDDFQHAAQFLVESGYTTHDQIVIQGGSNGGLLVGACINQRPDLFGAAIAQVGYVHYDFQGSYACSRYNAFIEYLNTKKRIRHITNPR